MRKILHYFSIIVLTVCLMLNIIALFTLDIQTKQSQISEDIIQYALLTTYFVVLCSILSFGYSIYLMIKIRKDI
jgi:uncharacterized membrane protein